MIYFHCSLRKVVGIFTQACGPPMRWKTRRGLRFNRRIGLSYWLKYLRKPSGCDCQPQCISQNVGVIQHQRNYCAITTFSSKNFIICLLSSLRGVVKRRSNPVHGGDCHAPIESGLAMTKIYVWHIRIFWH